MLQRTQDDDLASVPEVTVILPTCDRPHLVGRALDSLRAQTFTDFELLLVDGNRHEPPVSENPQLAEALQDPRVRVLDGRATRNAAMSRNVGLQAAHGTWIAFLDDDDAYRPDKVEAQHRLACTSGSPLVLCGYEFVWPGRRRRRQVDRARFCGDEILTRAFLGSPVLFHRRDDQVRFDERLTAGEDLNYALQLVIRHQLRELPCVPRPLVVVYPPSAGRSGVHHDKAAVWRACRVSARLATRGNFSRAARHALLAQGRLERSMEGYGGNGQFCRCVFAVLRLRGAHEWRFALYALLARIRHAAPKPDLPVTSHDF